MSHNYLFELYHYIDKRIEAANHPTAESGAGVPDADFTEGRIQALTELMAYLSENLTIKLPKRLRKDSGVIYMNSWKKKG